MQSFRIVICILLFALACQNTDKTEPTASPEITATPVPTPAPEAGKTYGDAKVLFEDRFENNMKAENTFLTTYTKKPDIYSDNMLKCYRHCSYGLISV